MDFWETKINVSKMAAQQQVAIINTFPAKKRFRIALNFADMGIIQTRNWIQEQHPAFSHLEVQLEFVRLMYYQQNKMGELEWQHYKKVMHKKIQKDWATRFRRMMAANNWTYAHVAKLGGFKNAKVVEATISRGLPAFAKVAVALFENYNTKKLPSKHI